VNGKEVKEKFRKDRIEMDDARGKYFRQQNNSHEMARLPQSNARANGKSDRQNLL
jgi:hypothetical protein